jgi:succinyl-CoA:(S)-malate CoA-transferase subunit A
MNMHDTEQPAEQPEGDAHIPADMSHGEEMQSEEPEHHQGEQKEEEDMQSEHHEQHEQHQEEDKHSAWHAHWKNTKGMMQHDKLPLSGVRVIDLGTFLGGPFAATMMAEFGAEVLKVEHPIAGDPMRRFGTPTKRHDATLAWLSEGRNKKSVTIDLRQEEGVQLFLKLIAKSDVLVENFRPGTMEEWSLDWDTLREANPGLVMLRVSGYGQTGPYRRRSGFAHIAHAFGGLSYLAGFPGETPVVPGTLPLADYISSIYGAIGIMLALRHRDKTGRGQVIDIGSYEAVFRLLDEIAAAYGLFGKIREREGAGSFVAVPHGHFRTSDNRWVAIACTTDKMFERLSEAMERPELASTGLYGEQRKRLAARDVVNQLVIEWVGSYTRDEVMRRCLEKQVPIGKVNNIADIFEDEHFQARGNIVSVSENGMGEVVVPGVIPSLSETPGRITNLGPTMGNATYEVMRELLEISADEIKQLRQHKII